MLLVTGDVVEVRCPLRGGRGSLGEEGTATEARARAAAGSRTGGRGGMVARVVAESSTPELAGALMIDGLGSGGVAGALEDPCSVSKDPRGLFSVTKEDGEGAREV